VRGDCDWGGVERCAGAAGGEHAGGGAADGSGEPRAGLGGSADNGAGSGIGTGVERDAGEPDGGVAGGVTVKRYPNAGKRINLSKHHINAEIKLTISSVDTYWFVGLSITLIWPHHLSSSDLVMRSWLVGSYGNSRMTGNPHLTPVSVGCVCLDLRSETQIFVDPG
jgi:hypothetical protein